MSRVSRSIPTAVCGPDTVAQLFDLLGLCKDGLVTPNNQCLQNVDIPKPPTDIITPNTSDIQLSVVYADYSAAFELNGIEVVLTARSQKSFRHHFECPTNRIKIDDKYHIITGIEYIDGIQVLMTQLEEYILVDPNSYTIDRGMLFHESKNVYIGGIQYKPSEPIKPKKYFKNMVTSEQLDFIVVNELYTMMESDGFRPTEQYDRYTFKIQN